MGAIAMIDSRHKKGLMELIPVIFFSWAHAKEIAAAREAAMNKAGRNIAQGAQQLMAMGFMAWAKMAGDDREINQERGRRRRMAEKGRAMVIKLRERLQARVAFDGWLIRSQMLWCCPGRLGATCVALSCCKVAARYASFHTGSSTLGFGQFSHPRPRRQLGRLLSVCRAQFLFYGKAALRSPGVQEFQLVSPLSRRETVGRGAE